MYLLYNSLNRENFSKYKDHERLYPLLSRDAGPVFVHETITQHTSRMASIVDINLVYTITKRKIYTNVEYNFHDRCTYVTLQAVFSFLGRYW